MAWVAPVTTWAPTDGIADTDLNRIEGNTEYLKRGDPLENGFWLSGNPVQLGGSYSLPASWAITTQELRRNIANGKKLVLRVASYYLRHGTPDILRLDVIGADATYQSGTLGYGDERPSTVLYSNSTGATVLTTIQVSLKNLYTVATLVGWATCYTLFFEIQDI